MLPAMIGLMIVLLRVNQAIQVSIVNQRYARGAALSLTFNSPYYPMIKYHKPDFYDKKYNAMVIGVSQNFADDEVGDSYTPEAATQLVARSKGLAKGNASDHTDEEPKQRGFVRIRTTVSMCTPSYVVKGATGELMPLTPNGMTDATQFEYCRSPQDE